ncbi:MULTISPECIES: MCE family protein [unclassified Nocardioides]|uniref:MCE family protein n=1 Tax=unclassified Nocardioides TaxID=2615069 RepID=UPI00360B696B
MTRMLQAVLGVVALALVVVLVRVLTADPTYHATLTHAGGLRTGDAVRVAGIDVGEVTDVVAEQSTVRVDFRLDQPARLTDDTATQVKLASLLGRRFLALEPGDGAELSTGDTISAEHAVDTYTIERFWLDASPKVDQLDLDTVSAAIETLGSSLAGTSGGVRSSLEGMTRVSEMVQRRDEQLDRLLGSTRSVTDTVLDQQDELDALLADADQVMTMIRQRREAIATLLRDGRALVTDLTALMEDNRSAIAPAIHDARTLLTTLAKHKQDLDEVLRLGGPAMRYFTNATGDGPWLGVNSPYFVLPDEFYCVLTPEKCS